MGNFPTTLMGFPTVKFYQFNCDESDIFTVGQGAEF
jgi:hypothetical protein